MVLVKFIFVIESGLGILPLTLYNKNNPIYKNWVAIDNLKIIYSFW